MVWQYYEQTNKQKLHNARAVHGGHLGHMVSYLPLWGGTIKFVGLLNPKGDFFPLRNHPTTILSGVT